jgi:protein-S-isoprenylcysteine O-methyltransferase Ste14
MYIIYGTYIIWGLSEVLLNRFVRAGKSDKQAADNHSELYIWLTIGISIAMAIYASGKFAFPIFGNAQFELIGIAVIFIGIILRFAAIKQLGKFFTVDVTIRKDHVLMQSGFYKYVRHPSYTGSLLSFLGFGISLNNWIGLALIFLPIFFSFINRMNIEEKVLKEQFGSQYTDYMKKTKRLIPFVY